MVLLRKGETANRIYYGILYGSGGHGCNIVPSTSYIPCTWCKLNKGAITMKNKTIVILAVIFAVGCCNKEEEAPSKEVYIKHRADNPHSVSNIREKLKRTAYKMEDGEIVEIELDKLSFGKAFNIENRAKGEGHMFWWRGNQYTTDLKRKE